MTIARRLSLALLAALTCTPALARHRQTPEIVQYTFSGDTLLPRLPARTTIVLGIASSTDTSIVTIKPYRQPSTQTPIAATGDNQNPTISLTGAVVAFDSDADPLGTGLPGRQIVLAQRGVLTQGPGDPTGTSVNPSLDINGSHMAFESTGDLAATGNSGKRQIFVRQPSGQIVQSSSGLGASRNPSLSAHQHLIAFQSTSDPMTGFDTMVDQIWLGGADGTSPPTRITNGLAASVKPSFSEEGAVVAFESRANLATDQTDLGAPQIFIYHVETKTFAQITREPGGCVDPAVGRFLHDWRVTFVCNGVGYIYFVRIDKRYDIQTGGDTTRVVPGPGVNFILVSTTGNLLAGTGTTPGHEIYQINLFKRPPEPSDPGYVASWFPFRGIDPAF